MTSHYEISVKPHLLSQNLTLQSIIYPSEKKKILEQIAFWHEVKVVCCLMTPFSHYRLCFNLVAKCNRRFVKKKKAFKMCRCKTFNLKQASGLMGRGYEPTLPLPLDPPLSMESVPKAQLCYLQSEIK